MKLANQIAVQISGPLSHIRAIISQKNQKNRRKNVNRAKAKPKTVRLVNRESTVHHIGCVTMEDPRFVSTFDNVTFNLVSLFFILMGLRAFNRNFKLYRFSECFPGAKCAFAVGNYFQYKLNPVDFLEKLTSDWKQFGCDKFRTWFGQHCFIVLTKPEEVKVVRMCSQKSSKNILCLGKKLKYLKKK